jgi:hypothetical protein
MSIRSLKLNDEDRRVYETWRGNLIMFWSFVVAGVAILQYLLGTAVVALALPLYRNVGRLRGRLQVAGSAGHVSK